MSVTIPGKSVEQSLADQQVTTPPPAPAQEQPRSDVVEKMWNHYLAEVEKWYGIQPPSCLGDVEAHKQCCIRALDRSQFTERGENVAVPIGKTVEQSIADQQISSSAAPAAGETPERTGSLEMMEEYLKRIGADGLAALAEAHPAGLVRGLCRIVIDRERRLADAERGRKGMVFDY